MHGHLLEEYGEAMGRIWLAYGITSVRNPAAMTPYMSLEDREAVEAGVRLGPRIFASGYQLDGPRIYYPLGLSIRSDTQLEWELERIKRLDLDFVKTYVRLPDRQQKRVVEFAHANGLPVTSHEIHPAVAIGADGTEHTSGTSRRGYSPKISTLQIAYNDVINLLARSGMTITPTASLGGGFLQLMQRDPSLLADPRYAGLFPKWSLQGQSRGTGGRATSQGIARTGRMVMALTAAGAKILGGTDSPITPYGLSLHAELRMFVQAGMTPIQALRTVTTAAADTLNAAQDLGAIEPGKLADFILVDGDPVNDITAAINVRGVVKNGLPLKMDELLGGASH
jgi:imidazolonepropionase-like amidohydrolase